MRRLLAIFFCLIIISIVPTTAYAVGDGNIDTGSGGMGQGTGSNKWSPGNDGVRITIVDAETGAIVSIPIDFSRRSQANGILHFGKVSKIQYRSGRALSPSSGGYECYTVANEMPIIISSNSLGQSKIEAIKRYFCSEYTIKRISDVTNFDYDRLIGGKYKLLIEPLAYFLYNGNMYCMSATEAAMYDQLANGNLKRKMASLSHQNLPLAMFLENSDMGFTAWNGPKSGKQSNADIINYLGLGIVRFKEMPIQGEIDAPDVEYRVDTDVITSVTLRANRDLTPDNPASVTFRIDGRTYTVNNIVIPEGDSQVVWVKWHTPSSPATLTIRISVSGAYAAKDSFKAKIVNLNEKIPPDPLATDTNPDYIVPPLPSNSQKTTANWGVWSCYWVPVWEWCDHSTEEDPDAGHWVDEGYWEFEYTGYTANLSGTMSLKPDDVVPTSSGKKMKSGYGVKTEVSTILSTNAPSGHYTYTQTALSTFPEFKYRTYNRLLERIAGGRNAKFRFQPNEYSTYNRNVHFLPVWFPDGKRFTVYTQVWDTWTPDGMLSVNVSDYVSIEGSLFDDWYSLELIYYSLLILFLVAFAVYDIKHKRVPDLALACFLPFILLSLPMNFAAGSESGIPIWLLSVIGALAGGGTLLFAALATDGGIGGGDIKLAAMLGVVYGPYSILLTLFYATLLTMLFGLYQQHHTGNRFCSLPFVPFLAIGCFTVTILKLNL